MRIEVVGYKGVVGGATYQWLQAMHNGHQILGMDKGDTPHHSEMAFICVPDEFVQTACTEVATYTDFMVVRSTVSPGTCKRLQMMVGKHICHNPEFLRQATAEYDIFNPAYILIGSCCKAHGAILQRLYECCHVPVVVVNTITSELVKIATNNYLACLISFWNEIEAICDASGVSGHRVGAIASLDPRVVNYGARYHHRYKGKCLPKEIDKMIGYAQDESVPVQLLSAIKGVNECQEY